MRKLVFIGLLLMGSFAQADIVCKNGDVDLIPSFSSEFRQLYKVDLSNHSLEIYFFSLESGEKQKDPGFY